MRLPCLVFSWKGNAKQGEQFCNLCGNETPVLSDMASDPHRLTPSTLPSRTSYGHIRPRRDDPACAGACRGFVYVLAVPSGQIEGANVATATAIVLADAQATPVNHTFNPIGKDEKEVFWFIDQSATNAIGFWRISVDISQPKTPQVGESSSRRVNRIMVGLHEPVLETVSNNTVSGIAPAPTVSYIPRVFCEFVVPERSALLDRQNLRKMAANLLANSNIVNVVENLNYLT